TPQGSQRCGYSRYRSLNETRAALTITHIKQHRVNKSAGRVSHAARMVGRACGPSLFFLPLHRRRQRRRWHWFPEGPEDAAAAEVLPGQLQPADQCRGEPERPGEHEEAVPPDGYRNAAGSGEGRVASGFIP